MTKNIDIKASLYVGILSIYSAEIDFFDLFICLERAIIIIIIIIIIISSSSSSIKIRACRFFFYFYLNNN